MDHHNNRHSYEPYNHLNYENPQCPPAPVPVSELPHPYYGTPAPGSPSDFIYNSANNSANATASIFLPPHPRPSRSSHPSVPRKSTPTSTPTSTLPYPQPIGYGPSRPVEQSFPTYLLTLSQPPPGLLEHRRQRESVMNMGPGQSKSVPPPLPLEGNIGSGSSSSSSESAVVITQEEGSSSPVLIPLPIPLPMPMPMKKWEPRLPTEPRDKDKREFKPGEFGNTVTEMGMNEMRSGGTGFGIGNDNREKWVNRGGGVMGRVVPSLHRASRPAGWDVNAGVNTGVNMGMGRDMGMDMEIDMGTDMGLGMATGMGMGTETGMEREMTMPKMGLFRPIRWDGPSSRSRSKAKKDKAGRAQKARRARGWELEESPGAGDVHLQRTYGNQKNSKRIARSNSNRNQTGNNETEGEDCHPGVMTTSSASHPYLPKRRKTSTTLAGSNFRTASAATVTTVEIKREPGLSPSPRATFAQIPMYSHSDPVTNSSGGYKTAGDGDENVPSSREISPLTRVPTPRRLLFPTSTPDRRQLRERNREVAVFGDWVGSRGRGLERRSEGFGFGNLVSSAGQDQNGGTEATQRDQHQNRGSSSEEKEEGWTAITISGSSEEGEVSSYYDNPYDSYSCGQERMDDAPHGAGAGGIYQAQRQPHHHFPSFSPSAQQLSSSSSDRYAPASGSEPSLSAGQQRVLEQYRQAIQVVQDACLEASKRYIRAHCVNRGVRGGESPGTDTGPVPRQTVESRSARKARRKRKLKTRHGSSSSDSSSSFFFSPSLPPPSSRQRQRRCKGKGRRQKRTETSPSSNSSFQSLEEITCTDSLLPNISQICTLLWSRSQSLRLHDTDSIELHTARNMYWLLSWAETVAFAVPPTSTHFFATSFSNETPETSVPGPDIAGVSVLEELGRREQWARPSPLSFPRRDLGPRWENTGDDLNNDVHMWRETGSEEGVVFKKFEGRNEGVWEQQWQEIRRVFEEGGMLCEFLGYGEGVERLGRIRDFYGF